MKGYDAETTLEGGIGEGPLPPPPFEFGDSRQRTKLETDNLFILDPQISKPNVVSVT